MTSDRRELTVLATVTELGDTKTISTTSGDRTKREVHCVVNGEHATYEIWGNSPSLSLLQPNKTFEFKLSQYKNYNPDITNVLESSAEPQAAKAVPQQSTTVRKPDFGRRWEQWNMHARTAQMQASERVGHYVQLAIAGKLSMDGKQAAGLFNKSTVENWYSEEIKRYWDELAIEEPQDAFGDLKGGE